MERHKWWVCQSQLGFAHVVTGFDLSEMGKDVFNDAIIDVVGSDTVMSEPYMIKVRALTPHFVCLALI